MEGSRLVTKPPEPLDVRVDRVFTSGHTWDEAELFPLWAPTVDGVDEQICAQVTAEVGSWLLFPEQTQLLESPQEEKIEGLKKKLEEIGPAVQVWRDLMKGHGPHSSLSGDCRALPAGGWQLEAGGSVLQGDIYAFALFLLESGGGGGGDGESGEDNQEGEGENGEDGEGGEEDVEGSGGQGKQDSEEEQDPESGSEMEGLGPNGEGGEGEKEVEVQLQTLPQAESKPPPPNAELLTKLLPSLRHGLGREDSTIDTKELEELSRKFQQDPNWRRLLDMIGRLSSMAWSSPARTPSTAREDVIGLELGDDPSRIIAAEMSRFAVPSLASMAYVDLLEKRMAQLCVEGDEPRATGPILVAVDVSSSMHDPSGLGMPRDKLAMILSMALARICDVQKRKIFLCGFDDGVRWHRAAKTTKQFVEMLTFLLSNPPGGGGTRFDPPLEMLCDEAAKEPRGGADLLFITDGESNLSSVVSDRVSRVRKSTGSRLFSLLLNPDDRFASPIEPISDEVIKLRSWEDLEGLTEQIAKKPASKTSAIR